MLVPYYTRVVYGARRGEVGHGTWKEFEEKKVVRLIGRKWYCFLFSLHESNSELSIYSRRSRVGYSTVTLCQRKRTRLYGEWNCPTCPAFFGASYLGFAAHFPYEGNVTWEPGSQGPQLQRRLRNVSSKNSLLG